MKRYDDTEIKCKSREEKLKEKRYSINAKERMFHHTKEKILEGIQQTL